MDEFFEKLTDAVADKVVARLRRATLPGMVDQSTSPLGPRLHIRAAKRRIRTGQAGAAHIGRRYLLTPEALHEELGRSSETPTVGGDDDDEALYRSVMTELGR